MEESVKKSNATLKSRCDRYTSFRERSKVKLYGLKKRTKSQATEHAKEPSKVATHHVKELEKEKNLLKKNERRFSREMSKANNQMIQHDCSNFQKSLSEKGHYEMQLRKQHCLHMKNIQMKASAHTLIVLDNAKQHEKVLKQVQTEHFEVQ